MTPIVCARGGRCQICVPARRRVAWGYVQNPKEPAPHQPRRCPAHRAASEQRSRETRQDPQEPEGQRQRPRHQGVTVMRSLAQVEREITEVSGTLERVGGTCTEPVAAMLARDLSRLMTERSRLLYVLDNAHEIA